MLSEHPLPAEPRVLHFPVLLCSPVTNSSRTSSLTLGRKEAVEQFRCKFLPHDATIILQLMRVMVRFGVEIDGPALDDQN